jgi:uncharacterized repeat protein (TIGR03803 family)
MKPLKCFQWGGRILSFVPPAVSLSTLTGMVTLCMTGVQATAQDYSILHSFNGGEGGAHPRAGLVQGTDGTLYGTAFGNDGYVGGMVFKINTNGSGFAVLLRFPTNDILGPEGRLVLSDSMLYGSTWGVHDGWPNYNTHSAIFKLRTDGGGFTVLQQLGTADHASGDLMLSDATLYGTTSGDFSSLHGTIFKLNTNGSGYTVLRNFPGSDGIIPEGGVILSGTNLYGTTEGGGDSYNGTVFKLNTDGTGYNVLKNFSASAFSASAVDPTIGVYTNSDGASPSGGLKLSGNTLYGTTQNEGSTGNGTVFKVNTDGSGFTVLKHFTGGDGASPWAGLALSGTVLYGTTHGGGISNSGTLFKLNTDGSEFLVLKHFTGSDGAFPWQGLVLSGTMLYGTTESGGTSNQGTLFALSLPLFPTIVAPPVSRVVSVGANVDFSVGAIGSPPLAYQWIFNATNRLPMATNSNLHLTNVYFTDAGAYTVVVTNAVGAVTSAPAILSVPPQGIVSACTEEALRVAIAGGGNVTFACDGTITLSNTITFSINTVLDASGHQVTISGGKAVRVFYVNTNVTFTAVNLTIADGQSANGAGIFNDGGNLNLLGTLLRSNIASASMTYSLSTEYAGGGVFNRGGTISGTNCAFLGNAAQAPGQINGTPSPARGGAILNESGLVNLQNCVFTADRASGGSCDVSPGADGSGGAIHNSGTLVVTRCTFIQNSATGGPGSWWSQYVYYLPGLQGGSATGGAIYNEGVLTVDSCTLASNTVAGGNGGTGGGGYNCEDNDNKRGGNGGAGGSGIGAALFGGGAANVVNTTFAWNTAAGGAGGAGGSGGRCTLSGGVGGPGGAGANGGSSFGAIYGGVHLTDCTLAFNTATGGSGGAGGGGGQGAYYNGSNGPGGAWGAAGLAGGGINGGWLLNTLLASNTPANGSGTITDAGHNLSSDGSCVFTSIGSLNNTDPKLGPLANNGGPTMTMALMFGSPAINAGTAIGAPATDQRGVIRPQGPGVDMGAFEYQYVPVITGAKFHSATEFWLQMSGLLPTQAFKLQTSTNLLNWCDFTNFVAGTNGLFEFVDCAQDKFEAHFYRIKCVTP